MPEGVVWIDGEFVAEHEAVISIRDPGFIYGDAVFDTARTFNGEIFKLDEHLDRLWMSCRYVDIEPPLPRARLAEITREVTARNYRGEDLWVTQRITRRPTVIVETTPLPLRERARYSVDAIPVVLPSVRRTPPWALSPRAKTHNYLNMIVARNESARANPAAWPILLDEFGNLCEGLGSNLFTVTAGVLRTPAESHVLAGISRATTLELARELGIEAHETAISPYDLAQADEAFLTSTSLCVCPVATVDGRPLRDPRVPGPVTERLQQAWKDLVGVDFVAQHTRFA